MAPSPSSAHRLFLLGCLLIGAVTLLLPGCGGDSAATAESTAASAAKAGARSSAKAATTDGSCPRRVNAFVDSLDELRRQLAIGLSFEQYAAKVRALRRSYDRLPISRLAFECVTATGTPAEATLNRYIDAANAWGECLADASCTAATIEPVLQGKWQVASRLLGAAE